MGEMQYATLGIWCGITYAIEPTRPLKISPGYFKGMPLDNLEDMLALVQAAFGIS